MKTIIIFSIIAFCLISIEAEAQLHKKIAQFNTEMGFIKQKPLKYNSDEKVIAFVTSDGKHLISANKRFINKWNLKTGEYRRIKLNRKFAHAEEIKYSPDGLHIAYAVVNHIYVINTKTGKTVYTLNWKNERYVNRKFYFSPNGKWCAIDGNEELFIVNLHNYSAERKSLWGFHDLKYINNRFVYFSEDRRKIYYYDLYNPKYYEKISGSRDAIFGFDVSQEGKHGTLWFSKRRGYIHSKRYTYKNPANGKKELIKEEIERIRSLTPQYISILHDLIPTSGTIPYVLYNYIDKNTGLIYESEHKITNTDHFVSPYNNEYYIKVHNLHDPSKDIYLFQHKLGNWLIVKGDYFDSSPLWLNHEKIKPLIMDYYSPGLVAINSEPNNNLFSTSNELKLRAFMEYIVNNKDKTILKKWFFSNFKDLDYDQSLENLLSQNCQAVRFQNQQWYGDSKKLMRIHDNKVYFAFIEDRMEDAYTGIYGIEDSLLVKGKIKHGELIEGKMFYKASVEAGSEGAISYAVYDGEYKNWKWHGNGVLTWPDGAKYVGEFVDGYIHGHGKYFDAKGNIIYEGEFEKGKKVKRKPSSSDFSKDRENNSNDGYWYQATWKRTDSYKDIYLDLSSNSPVFCGTGGNSDNVDISSIDWNSSYTKGYFTMRDKISGTEAKMLIEKSDENNLILSLIKISTGEPYSPGYYTKSDGWCD
ncbi:MAG: hypothetical protein ACLFVR_08545 [Thiohalospira sp.]